MTSASNDLAVQISEDREHWREELLSEREYWANRVEYWRERLKELESVHRRAAVDRVDYSDEDRDRDSADVELVMAAAAFCEARLEVRQYDIETCDDPDPSVGPWPVATYDRGYLDGVTAQPRAHGAHSGAQTKTDSLWDRIKTVWQ
ncbi:hypothetical protein [Mycobacterium antarcticum]|uniref:hypothetical protein n=1 Tax=Mycolicibacterium sp. TUM20984 TaxID=3023368 RepID=UPI002391C376|nr:hypothetical protein [Mycolicibacterium sp. TUM20984]GLP83580.1 hypothetical protein TUM20984_50000 [Mycolicibacterium sp. TUM20984]